MKWYLLDRFPDSYREELNRIEGIVVEDLSPLPEAAILERLHDADGFLFRSRFRVDRPFLDRYPNLKWIVRVGVGLDHVDCAYAETRGVKVFHTPGVNARAVAVHTLGLLLALLKKIVQADREVHQWLWRREENKGNEPWDLTVGIIGFGNTGSAFGHLLAPMVKRILVYDKYKTVQASANILPSSWEEIYEEADALSFHVPLTEETHFYFNRERLARFQKPFYLLNVSRGKVVETAALIQGLKEGKIVGAGLDVLENEELSKLSEKERSELRWLLEQPNVIITPHIAGWSFESDRNALEMVIALLKRILQEPVQKQS